MYPVSDAFKETLDGRNRIIEWLGTITLVNGQTYNFNMANVVQGTGMLTCACDLPGVGGAYATELRIQLFIDIAPRQLDGATINLHTRLTYSTDVGKWGEAIRFHWADLASSKWGDSPRSIYTDVPMGLFLVTEAQRAINSIKITAYDYMQKFDKALPQMDAQARTPFNWTRWACSACGVPLGITNAQLKTMPNGSRNFTYADIDSNVVTYRDLLSDLAASLGSIAVINRFGQLVFIERNDAPVADITPDNRFTSDFADYQSRYTGIYAQYKAKAVQEYYRNVSTLTDNGLIIDVGCNAFLQISNDSNRATAIQAIIDTFKNKYFTPFDVSMPFNPAYDLLDVLSFSGGHTPENSSAPIMSITRKIGGAMSIRCDSPEPLSSPVRESTHVDGVSGGIDTGSIYASSDFWILIDSFPDESTVITSDTLTTELIINCTVDNTCTQIAWTGAYSIDEDATVTVKVLVDDVNIYEVSDDQKAGNHVLNVTTGHTITTQGAHTVKVMLQEVAL